MFIKVCVSILSMKARLSLSVDVDILKKAKRNNINLSAFLEDKLRDRFKAE